MAPFRVRRGLDRRSWVSCVAVVVVGAAALSGCDVNRVNHVHSSANLEKAQAASDAFESVRSDRTGLPAKMLANLKAQQKLRVTVAEESNRFFDLADLQLVGDIRWIELREELLDDLGFTWDEDLADVLLRLPVIRDRNGLSDAERDKLLRTTTMIAVTLAKFIKYENSLTARERESLRLPLRSLRNDWVSAPLDQLPEWTESEYGDRLEPGMPALRDLVRSYTPAQAKAVIDPEASVETIGQRFNLDRPTDVLHETRGAEFLAPPVAKPGQHQPDAIVAFLLHANGTPDPGGEKSRTELLQDQINTRLKLVAKVISVYEVLIKGERARIALLARSQRNLTRATQARLERAGASEGDDAEAEPRQGLELALTLLFDIRKTINDYWRDGAVRREYMQRAAELQRRLVNAAEQTRDPASVYSLVPLTGEGLHPSDLQQLREYIDHLARMVAESADDDNRFETLLIEIETAGTSVSRSIRALHKSADVLDEIAMTARELAGQDVAAVADVTRAEFARDVPGQLKEVSASLNGTYLALRSVQPVESIELLQQLREGLIAFAKGQAELSRIATSASILADLTREEAAQENAMLDAVLAFGESARRLQELLPSDDGEGLSIDAVMKSVLEAADQLELDLDLAEAAKIGERIGALEAPLNALVSGKKLESSDVAALITLVAGDTEDIDAAVEVLIDQETLEYLNDLLGDVAAESKAVTKRIVDLLVGLERLHQRLREENVRHYLALTAIVKSEIVRWQTLAGLSQDLFERLYDDQAPVPNDDQAPVPTRLFTDAAGTGAWLNRGITDETLKHQEIKVEHKVIGSIRLLAETAQKYQTSSPRLNDSTGEQTQVAAERLARAAAILQAYQLMTTINRRAAADNSIALIGEVQEHSFLVDDIVISGVEVEIRYGLDTLIAFHASGITQDDLDTIARFLQAGLLAWIGSGV